MAGELEANFQFLIENSIDIVCRARMDMVFDYVSPSSLHVLGWLPEEMIGRRPDAFFLPEDASLIAASFSPMVDSSPVTVRMRMKNGRLAWMEIHYRVVFDSVTADPREIVIIIRDTTERKALADRLSVLEVSDARTGLSTTRALEEALDREWSRMVREGSQLSLLLLDFDGFHQFHSGSQHHEGDRCLAEIAGVIHGVLRLTDAAAHHRSEQIAILLSSTGSYGAATVAGKVRSAIQSLVPARGENGDNRPMTAVHIGIASTRARAGATNRMPELLLCAAESALQKAIERDAALVSDTL